MTPYLKNGKANLHGMKFMLIDYPWQWLWPMCDHNGVGGCMEYWLSYYKHIIILCGKPFNAIETSSESGCRHVSSADMQSLCVQGNINVWTLLMIWRGENQMLIAFSWSVDISSFMMHRNVTNPVIKPSPLTWTQGQRRWRNPLLTLYVLFFSEWT